MRFHFFLVIGLAAVGLMPNAADAEGFYDGNALYTDCKTDLSVCTGYVSGVADTMLLIQDSGFAAKKQCLIAFEPGTNNEQLKDVAVNFLRDHPEQRQRPASALVWNALITAFKCKK